MAGDDGAYSSYIAAYNAGKAAGAGGKGANVAGSRASSAASTHRYSPSPQRMVRRSPVSPQPDMIFSPVPQKMINVMNRPATPNMGMKNVENLDHQYQKDKAAFERHANVYRKNVGEKWHHNGPSVLTLWEQGHIVDKGKARTAMQAAHGVFDPILSEFKVSPAMLDPSLSAVVSRDRHVRPASAPHIRPGTAPGSVTTHREDKVLQAARGTRDPITGDFKPGFEAAPIYDDRKQVEFERAFGGRGIASKSSKDWAYDPITGRHKPLSPAARALYHDLCTADGVIQVTATPSAAATPTKSAAPSSFTAGAGAGGDVVKGSPGPVTAVRAASNAVQRPASAPRLSRGGGGPVTPPPAVRERPCTPTSKRTIHSGETWGQYNPINHVWSAMPANSKYHDPSEQHLAKHGMTGTHVRKAEMPANQGVYNPITNTWIVAPANPRIVNGLSFAPATMFSRTTPSTIRA